MTGTGQIYFVFLSTPSSRRATSAIKIAYPKEYISIHALLAEGDPMPPQPNMPKIRFLSTPSSRRATYKDKLRYFVAGISIHALLAEGDVRVCHCLKVQPEFLSTPSSRRATYNADLKPRMDENFYPRPPRGGRQDIEDRY